MDEKRKMKRRIITIVLLLAAAITMGKWGRVLAQRLSELTDTAYVYLPLVFRSYTPGPSKLSGKVINERSERPIVGVYVYLDEDHHRYTDSNGEYWFDNLLSGIYSIMASKQDFITKTEVIALPSDANYRRDFRLLPELSDGQMRITVTWNETPSWQPDNVDNDLDIHLWTPFDKSSGYYHISVDNVGNCQHFENESYPCLEAEASKGSGPEIVALYPVNGDFAFGVLNYYYGYLGVPSITDLDAKVVVERYEGLTETFYVPQTGTGDFWYVFNIEDGVIVTEDLNCITWAGNPLVDPPVCPQP